LVAIEDPSERLRTGLNQIYRYYGDTAHMWTRVLRDRELVHAVEPTLAPFNDHVERATKVLASGWGVRGSRRGVLSAAVRHAIDLGTWRSLVEHGGVSRRQAVELMVALVERASGE
jgi:hypothetical protein